MLGDFSSNVHTLGSVAVAGTAAGEIEYPGVQRLEEVARHRRMIDLRGTPGAGIGGAFTSRTAPSAGDEERRRGRGFQQLRYVHLNRESHAKRCSAICDHGDVDCGLDLHGIPTGHRLDRLCRLWEAVESCGVLLAPG